MHLQIEKNMVFGEDYGRIKSLKIPKG
jgi:hypothetical protein